MDWIPLQVREWEFFAFLEWIRALLAELVELGVLQQQAGMGLGGQGAPQRLWAHLCWSQQQPWCCSQQQAQPAICVRHRAPPHIDHVPEIGTGGKTGSAGDWPVTPWFYSFSRNLVISSLSTSMKLTQILIPRAASSRISGRCQNSMTCTGKRLHLHKYACGQLLVGRQEQVRQRWDPA